MKEDRYSEHRRKHFGSVCENENVKLCPTFRGSWTSCHICQQVNTSWQLHTNTVSNSHISPYQNQGTDTHRNGTRQLPPQLRESAKMVSRDRMEHELQMVPLVVSSERRTDTFVCVCVCVFLTRTRQGRGMNRGSRPDTSQRRATKEELNEGKPAWEPRNVCSGKQCYRPVVGPCWGSVANGRGGG